MKTIIFNLKNIYYKIYTLFIAYSLLNIFLVYLYRYDIFSLIQLKYPEYLDMQFLDYLSLSFYFDSVIITIFILLLACILFCLRNSLKITFYIASGLMIAQLIFFKLTTEFFRIYETTFHPDYLGNEGNVAIREMIGSGLAEFSFNFYFSSIFLIILIILITYLMYLFSNISLTKSKKAASNYRTIHYLKYTTPVFVMALLVFQLPFNNDSRFHLYAKRYPDAPQTKTINTLKNLSMNPMYGLLFADNIKEQLSMNVMELPDNIQPPPLQTDSLESPIHFNRLNIKRNNKYNIILYFFESTAARYLDIKVKGKYVTPNWNRFKQNCFVAQNHYVNNPLSASSMLSVFTSNYDINTKTPAIQKHPEIDIKTISEKLKNNGYRTCLIHPGDLRYANQTRFLKNKKFDRIIQLKDLKKPPYDYRIGWGLDDRTMIEPSAKFAKEDPDSPFFLVLLPISPHHPYTIPGEEFNITKGLNKNDFEYNSSNWLKYLNALYYSDYVLGEIIDNLEKQGLMDNTLLFLFADHGEAFYQHRQNYNHPFFLYEENVHVPFIIYNKKIFKKSIYYNGISRHIDIFPTVLDAIGLHPDKGHEGISLFSRHMSQLALFQTNWGNHIMGLRDGKWKYIYNIIDMTDELYNLTDDPNERINLAGNNKKIIENYRKYVKNAQHYLNAYYSKLLGKKTYKKI